MSKFIDLTGQRFGRLVVVGRAENIKRQAAWLCRCDCGKTTTVVGYSLRAGLTKSCRCLSIEITQTLTAMKIRKHRESRTKSNSATKEYKAYGSMKDRCLNKNHPDYHNYGGRGITISDSWLEDYVNFLSDMGRAPEGTTLERKDNSREYSKENCCWATMKDQSNNTRRNVLLTYDGETLTIAQWADKTGLKWLTLWQRIKYFKWPVSKALTTPVMRGGSKP